MYDYIFQAKRIDNGEWIEGYYIHLTKRTYCFKEDYEADKDNDIHQIIFQRPGDWGLPNQHLCTNIDPKTLRLWTGLYDKHGRRIFDGDVIAVEEGDPDNPELITFVVARIKSGKMVKDICYMTSGKASIVDEEFLDEGYLDTYEVQGNIFEGKYKGYLESQ